VVTFQADPSGMSDAIAGMAEQLRAGERTGAEAGTELGLPAAVVMAGMGGSAMGGELLRALIAADCPVPITRVRGFGVPAWAGPGTLVVCTSYSGDTAETLACAQQAHAQGASLLAVASGGELARLADELGFPCALVPGGMQPRAALGYLFGAMAGAFTACGLAASDIAEQCASGVEAVGAMITWYMRIGTPARCVGAHGRSHRNCRSPASATHRLVPRPPSKRS